MKFPAWIEPSDGLMRDLIRVRNRGVNRLDAGCPEFEVLPDMAASVGIAGDPRRAVPELIARVVESLGDATVRNALRELLGVGALHTQSGRQRRKRVADQFFDYMSLTAFRAENGPERLLLEMLSRALLATSRPTEDLPFVAPTPSDWSVTTYRTAQRRNVDRLEIMIPAMRSTLRRLLEDTSLDYDDLYEQYLGELLTARAIIEDALGGAAADMRAE